MFKKTLTIGTIVLFIILILNPHTIGHIEKFQDINYDGNTLFVGGNGPNNYTKIQDAIDNASNGDIVFVYNDTYNENLIIDKTLSLVGQKRNNTIINGGGIEDAIKVFADGVSISGFMITNGGQAPSSEWVAGILVNSHYNTISNNILDSNNKYGVYLNCSSYNNIHDNIMKDNINNEGNGGGVFIYHSYNNNVTNNYISSDASFGIGIYYSNSNDNYVSSNTLSGFGGGINLNYAARNTLENNIFIMNGIGISGTQSQWNTHTITGNIANGRPIYYYKNVNDVKVPDDAAQVILANCNNFIIKNLNLSDVDDGISLGYSSNNTICDNVISSCHRHGINVWGSSNNTIYNNYLSLNDWYGINIWQSGSNNLVYHNDFVSNYEQARDDSTNLWYNSSEFSGNYWDDFDESSEGAYDNNSDGVVDSPYDISGGDNQDLYPLIEPWTDRNHAPNPPDIDGPTQGNAGESYNYIFVADDLDDDDVYYCIAWGDEDPNQLFDVYGPYPSGIPASINHTWKEEGTYLISAFTIDIHFDISETTTLEVNMPRNKPIVRSFKSRFPVSYLFFNWMS